MKNNKKFILAAGAAALGLVAATGVTSGFAWFATNADSLITTGNIIASTDQSFLLVKEGSYANVADFRANPAPTGDLNVDTTDVELLPSAFGYNSIALNATNAAAPGNWYTTTSDSWNSAAKGTNATETPLVADAVSPATPTAYDFSKYVLKKTFTFGLAQGSAAVDGLALTNVTIDNDTTAGLAVIFAYGTSATDIKASSTTQVDLVTGNAGSFTDSTVFVLTAYFYIDGNNANVMSANASTIQGTISFTVNTLPIAGA